MLHTYYCDCDGQSRDNGGRGVVMCAVGVGGARTAIVCPRCGQRFLCVPHQWETSPYFQTFADFYALHPGCPVRSRRSDEADQPIVR